VIFVNVY
ncbi:putative membrane protein, partial [Chlamydia psittaci 03DC35]